MDMAIYRYIFLKAFACIKPAILTVIILITTVSIMHVVFSE